MSNDETGSTEGQGIPGFSSNNSIPGGFTLPIPMGTAAANQTEETPADPWSSTWDDTSWQSGDAGETGSGGGTPVDSSSNDWSDSYEYGGDHTVGYDAAQSSGYSAHNGTSEHNGWASWEPSDLGVSSTSTSSTSSTSSTAGTSPSALAGSVDAGDHWATLQRNADVAAASDATKRDPHRAAWIARLRELGVLDIPGVVERTPATV